MISTTRISSKGQVVIPEEIRERLGLSAGTHFVVVGEGDVVVLRRLEPPKIEEFDRLIAQARQAARTAGLKKDDVARAVARARTSTEEAEA